MTPRAAVTSPRQNADRSSPRQRADPEEDDGPGARGPDDPSSERTPLLPRNDDCDVLNGKAATPLPKRPVFALLLCRLVEPVAFSAIFPFINAMVEDTGVDPSDVGYRAGLIESLFTITQFLTILQWGRLSDRIGRKPVILFGLAGVAVSVLAFGFSRTFLMMVITRCLAGALNGNVGVIKSSLAELTDHTNEAKAFTYLPLFWTIGAALGPVIGGYLSNPAERYPGLFGGSRFLKEYKYFLPCFVGALSPLASIVVGWFFLAETLPKRQTSQDGAEDGQGTPEPVGLPSIWSVFTRRVVLALSNYGILAFTSMSVAGILPLFMYTPVRLGGLGFSEAEIGKALSIQSIVTALIQLLCFAPIQRRLGTIGTYRLAVIFYPLGCAAFPVTSYFAARDGASPSTWISLFVLLTLFSIANLAYGCNMLLINSAAPSQLALGTVNGLAQMLAALVRSAGLAISPSLFAFTIKKHLLGGQAIWLYLVICGLLLCVISWSVTDAKAAWRDEVVKRVEDEEDDE